MRPARAKGHQCDDRSPEAAGVAVHCQRAAGHTEGDHKWWSGKPSDNVALTWNDKGRWTTKAEIS